MEKESIINILTQKDDVNLKILEIAIPSVCTCAYVHMYVYRHTCKNFDLLFKQPSIMARIFTYFSVLLSKYIFGFSSQKLLIFETLFENRYL